MSLAHFVTFNNDSFKYYKFPFSNMKYKSSTCIFWRREGRGGSEKQIRKQINKCVLPASTLYHLQKLLIFEIASPPSLQNCLIITQTMNWSRWLSVSVSSHHRLPPISVEGNHGMMQNVTARWCNIKKTALVTCRSAVYRLQPALDLKPQVFTPHFSSTGDKT